MDFVVQTPRRIWGLEVKSGKSKHPKGMSEFKKATQEIKENLNIEDELKEAKKDLIDSVSGLDKPEEPAHPGQSEDKKPTYQDFDEMLDDYQSMKEEKETEATAPTDVPGEPAAPKDPSETNRHDG